MTTITEDLVELADNVSNKFIRTYNIPYRLKDDFRSEGRLALVLALEKYDPESPLPLTGWVSKKIKWALLEYRRSVTGYRSSRSDEENYSRASVVNPFPFDYPDWHQPTGIESGSFEEDAVERLAAGDVIDAIEQVAPKLWMDIARSKVDHSAEETAEIVDRSVATVWTYMCHLRKLAENVVLNSS